MPSFDALYRLLADRVERLIIYCRYFKFDKVRLRDVLPNMIPSWFAMYFVVAFSSCLDVAAIQTELGRQLDFNHELCTVGISNFVSGPVTPALPRFLVFGLLYIVAAGKFSFVV